MVNSERHRALVAAYTRPLERFPSSAATSALPTGWINEPTKTGGRSIFERDRLEYRLFHRECPTNCVGMTATKESHAYNQAKGRFSEGL